MLWLQAAAHGHRHILSYLFKKGGSPTLRDRTYEAMSLLHWACQEGQLSLVKLLVPLCVKEQGAYNFEEFISLAISRGHIAIVEYLVWEVGAVVTSRTRKFLRQHKRFQTLERLKEIETLSGFLKKGHNPFLSVHRINQICQAVKEDGGLSDPLWESLRHWSYDFVHDKDKYVQVLGGRNKKSFQSFGIIAYS